MVDIKEIVYSKEFIYLLSGIVSAFLIYKFWGRKVYHFLYRIYRKVLKKVAYYVGKYYKLY